MIEQPPTVAVGKNGVFNTVSVQQIIAASGLGSSSHAPRPGTAQQSNTPQTTFKTLLHLNNQVAGNVADKVDKVSEYSVEKIVIHRSYSQRGRYISNWLGYGLENYRQEPAKSFSTLHQNLSQVSRSATDICPTVSRLRR